MINLLPYNEKKNLSAARANTTLLRYNLILAGAILLLAMAIGVVYLFLMNIRSTAEATISENRSKEQSYAQVRQDAQAFQTKLSDAKSIFDNEVSYSRALIRYANLFPEGTAISNIKLDSNSFDQPTEAQVRIRDEGALKRLISTMNNSEYVTSFEQKDISLNESDRDYPYTVDVTFTISKEIAQ